MVQRKAARVRPVPMKIEDQTSLFVERVVTSLCAVSTLNTEVRQQREFGGRCVERFVPDRSVEHLKFGSLEAPLY
jgi:hypothetical protein